MILLCSTKCRPKKKRVSCFSPPMTWMTHFVIFYTDLGSVIWIYVMCTVWIFFPSLKFIKFGVFLLIMCCILLCEFELFFTATKLRQFSDFKLGITIPVRGESSDLLNAEEEKNDYDW